MAATILKKRNRSAARARVISTTVPQTTRCPAYERSLEEMELAGWETADDRGNTTSFHECLPLANGRVIVAVGHVRQSATTNTSEATSLTASIRSALVDHAAYTTDAGRLLSLVNRSAYWQSTGEPVASLAVAVIDALGGGVQLALAGDILALRIRAAERKSAGVAGTYLGIRHDAAYTTQPIELLPRERLALVAIASPATARTAIERQFTRLTAETHRHMTADETLARVRRGIERTAERKRNASGSAVVVRRS
jgi:hypothetical protein